MAYFTQPVITNIGRSNLLKDGLTITRVAFGLGYSSSPATQTRLNQEIFSVTNAVLVRETSHLVISCVVDNQALNLTSSRTIKEIGIYARIGSESEFLLAYSYYSQGDTIPSKSEAHYQRDWQFRLGMSNVSVSSISYNTSTNGYASAGIVNSVSQRLSAHEANKNNPHGVTKLQIGLSNVDNIQQATKAEFNSHVADNTKHITPAERQRWDKTYQNNVISRAENLNNKKKAGLHFCESNEIAGTIINSPFSKAFYLEVFSSPSETLVIQKATEIDTYTTKFRRWGSWNNWWSPWEER